MKHKFFILMVSCIVGLLGDPVFTVVLLGLMLTTGIVGLLTLYEWASYKVALKRLEDKRRRMK